MISLAGEGDFITALNLYLPPDLKPILADIVAHTAAMELLHLTHLVVVEPGDSLTAIEEEIGYSPIANPTDGIRYDRRGFWPYWAYLRRRGSYYELIHPIGNDGFATILLVHEAADRDIVSMCERYVGVEP